MKPRETKAQKIKQANLCIILIGGLTYDSLYKDNINNILHISD